MKKILLLSLLLLPSAVSAQTDSIQSKKDDLPGYKRLEQRFADYTLQGKKLQVSKKFTDKKFLDHFFLECGGDFGASFIPRASGASWKIAFGDWVTPDHGWRIGFGSGRPTSITSSDFKAITLDYMMNMLSVAKYETNIDRNDSRRFGLYGFLGLDLMQMDKGKLYGIGGHAGLRGQYRLTDFMYVYLEPKLSIYSKKVVVSDSWRRMYAAASVSAGMGYFINQTARQKTANEKIERQKGESFLGDMFVSFSGGMSAIIDKEESRGLRNYGPVGSLGVGKWFNPANGLRLELGASVHKQNEPHMHSSKAIYLGADYLLNFDNLFGGNAQRTFYMNILAGPRLNFSRTIIRTPDHELYNDRHTTFGFTAGAQFNVVLSPVTTLFLEPRVDVNQNEFALYASKSGPDVTPALLFGVSLHKANFSPRMRELRKLDKNFAPTKFGRLFVEIGAGAGVPLVVPLFSRNIQDHLSPTGHLGIGTWFNPRHGLRLWGEAANWNDRPNLPKGYSSLALAMGIDYMWNITNTINGYIPGRKLELVGQGTLNVGVSRSHRKPIPGFGSGLQAIWNISPEWSLYIEPQARVYGKDYMPSHAFIKKFDITAALMLGARVHMLNGVMRQYRSEDDRIYARELSEDFVVSAAAGLAGPARGLKHSRFRGPMARISFGRWNSGFTMWRVNLMTTTHKGNIDNNAPYLKMALGADYIFDLTNFTHIYRSDRVFSTRTHIGANLAFDRLKTGRYLGALQQDGVFFTPDIHAGGSFNFRITPKFELYIEAQMAYQFKGSYASFLDRFIPSGLLGINYRLNKDFFKNTFGKKAR